MPVHAAPTFEALPKIVLLLPDLIVGVTGDNPHEVIEDVVTLRNDPIESVLGRLVSMTSAGFVVAALQPTRLWSIGGGQLDERTSVGRGWSGDRHAYDLFRTSWNKWPTRTEMPFLLSSSMQFLTSFDPVTSVGDFTLTAHTQVDGFRFQPLVTAVAVSHQIHVLPGEDPTRGTLGLLIPQTDVGLVFRHDRPWRAERIQASSPRSLITMIGGNFGDRLIESASPPGFPFGSA